MRLLRYKILVVCVLLLALQFASADNGDGGLAGAFLQVPIGARPTALGGAYRAISDDGAGPLFNPAGVAELKKNLFGSSYRAMQLDRKVGYATILFPIRNNAVVGLNWLYAGYGSVATRNRDGDLLGDEVTFNNHDIGIVFAKAFEKYLSAGVKMSYVQAKFLEMTAFSVSVDFGVMFYASQLVDREKRDLIPVQNIQFGLTVKNLAAKYRWDSGDLPGTDLGVVQDDEVPLEIALGGSARFLNRKLLLASDIVKIVDQGARFHTGAEYFVAPEFALRAGFSDGRITGGTGYVFKMNKRTIAVDYAFATDKASEGSEHIFSIDFLF